MVSSAEIAARVVNQFPQTVQMLQQLIPLRSYAGPDAPPGVLHQSAELVAQLLRGVGVTDVRVVEAGGGPGVIGQRLVDPAAPTVLLYAHHDVQPVANDWSTDPWQGVEKNGRLYGRGAADDAAGLALHVAVLAALGEDLPVNVKFLVEGEEESGSPTLDRLLQQHHAALRADVAVIADSDNVAVDTPSLTTSLRGLADLTVTLRVAEHAVHSGMWGGVYLDAPTCLARLISTLHDASGAVAVAGLEPEACGPAAGTAGTSEVSGTPGAPEVSGTPGTSEVSGTPGASDLVGEAEVRRAAGVVDGLKLSGRGSVTDRLWRQCAIAVIGWDSTSVDASSNTIQPVARARLSLRVAPGMDPVAAQAALRRHLVEHAPFGTEVTVEDGPTGLGFQADAAAPAYQAATLALTEAFGRPLVPLGQGGSIPVAAQLQAAFPELEVLITGVEDPDSRAHAGDESVDLELLRKAVLGEALMLCYLAS
ncbi:MAG: M20/M25/M40 family metallo-hydrolase [Bifidobacteriaceae bacterium]|nr:M20/M25/M40 family metallo-hydrolase [Bifidobacteriaceae bacterium]